MTREETLETRLRAERVAQLTGRSVDQVVTTARDLGALTDADARQILAVER